MLVNDEIAVVRRWTWRARKQSFRCMFLLNVQPLKPDVGRHVDAIRLPPSALRQTQASEFPELTDC